MRVVLDTNVLVSGFTATTPILQSIMQAWREGIFELVVSEHILREMGIAWNKPYWQARLPPELARRAIEVVRESGIVIPVASHIEGVADHVEDDLIVATAIDGNADVIVTGDKGLLRVGTYQGVAILSPTAFRTLLP